MKYINLIKNIKQPIFSLHDLKLMGLKVYPYQLSGWASQGYIIKLKNGLYAITEKKNELTNEHIAFNLYQPSYLSLEWALAKYGLIPEMVYSATSVTTRTTRTFRNEFGVFSYRRIKNELFFGYQKVNIQGQVYLAAEPEKALFDYVYLNSSKLNNHSDINELRLNVITLRELSQKKLKKYFKAAGSRKILKIYKLIFNENA